MSLIRLGNAAIRNLNDIYAIRQRVFSTPAVGKLFSIPYGTRYWTVSVETPGGRLVIGRFAEEAEADKIMANLVQQLEFVKLNENCAVRPCYVDNIRICDSPGGQISVEICFNVKGDKVTMNLADFDTYESAAKFIGYLTDIINSVGSPVSSTPASVLVSGSESDKSADSGTRD